MQPRSIVRIRIISLVAACSLAFPLLPGARADELAGESGDPGPRARASLGLMLGGPTGATLEKDLPGGDAWDLGLAAVYGPGLRLHGDFLWTLGATRADPDLFVRFQLGVGALAGALVHPCQFYGDFGTCDGAGYLGARVPFAVELWPRAPLNFGLEVAPVVAFNRSGAAGFLDAFAFVRLLL